MNMKTKRVILLGATGSIGTSTLDVLSSFPEKFRIVGLSAHTNSDKLLQIARNHPGARTALTGILAEQREGIDFYGSTAAVQLIESLDADIVVNGIMGSAGLAPSAAAIEAGNAPCSGQQGNNCHGRGDTSAGGTQKGC